MATFTALNGDARTPVSPTAASAIKRLGSEEQTPTQQLAADSISRQPPPPTREQWSGHGSDRHSQQPPNRHDLDSNKRKRSITPDRRREISPTQEPRVSVDRHDSLGSPRRETTPDHEVDRRDQQSWHSQLKMEDRHNGRRSSTESLPSPNDELGDGLSRPMDNADSRSEYAAMSPDGDERSMTYFGSSQRGDAVVQSDPKKRKRNFSNRTKTGCLTCRRRKKKCDETKPECTNCLRGAFVCQGYPNQRGYQKMESKPATVPLESKDPSYVPPGAYGMPQQHNNYAHSSHPTALPPVQSPVAGPSTVAPAASSALAAPLPPPTSAPMAPPAPRPRRDSSPHYRGQMLRIDTPNARQILHDNPVSSFTPKTATSPVNKLPLPSPSNMYPTPISAVPAKSATSLQSALSFGGGRSPEQQRLPPVHTVSIAEREERDDHRHDLHIHDRLQPLPRPDERRESQDISPTSPAYADPRIAARLALSQTTARNTEPARTQKQEMVRGAPYLPHDKELALERQRCSAACLRFNKASNPNKGIAASEQLRLFKQIIYPEEPVALPREQTTPEWFAGHLGEDVVIEAPFNCDYGYNISIGSNVLIGRNCTILDPMRISIGANSIIGPNVSIYGTSLETDPRARRGAKSQQTGRTVVIEEDVFIGGNCVILPGVKIGRGSTVGAGSVVTRDIAPFCVASGNPAQVKRGAHG